MPRMSNARPGAGSGTGVKMAGETTTSVTDPTDITAVAVPVWMRRRGGDPVTTRRRNAARLDDLVDAARGRLAEPYAAGGMTLGVPEREEAAPAPIGCAA